MGGTRILLWVAIVLIAAWFFYSVRSILFPFAFGLFAAALLDPSIRKLRLRGLSRAGAVVFMFLLFFSGLAVAALFLGPRLWTQVLEVRARAAEYVSAEIMPGGLIRFLGDPEMSAKVAELRVPTAPAEFEAWLRSESPMRRMEHEAFFSVMAQDLSAAGLPVTRGRMLAEFEELTRPAMLDVFLAQNRALLERLNLPTTPAEADRQFRIMERIESASKEIVEGAFGGAAAIIQFFISSIFLVIMTPIITLLILLDYDNFRRRLVTWIPPTLRPSATELLSDVGEVLSGYVRGLTKSIVLYSILMIVMLLLLGIPYAIFLGLLFGVLYLIPYIGNWISAAILVLAVFMTGRTGTILVDFGSTMSYAVVAFIVFLIVGTAYDIFGHPRVIGRSIGLHPVVAFFVIFAGAALFGLAGMILAFPIAGLVKVILDRLIRYTTTAYTDPPPDAPVKA